MKHLFAILIAIATSAIAFVSCSDSDEPADNDLGCVLPGFINHDHILKGTAFYDSVNSIVAITLDTTSFDRGYREYIPEASDYKLYPSKDSTFSIKSGANISFRITKIGYYHTTDGVRLYGSIADVIEIPSAQRTPCVTFDSPDSRSTEQFDTDFHNEIITDKVVRVYLHIIRDVSGFGRNEPEKLMSQMSTTLNEKFINTKISFDFAGYEFHDYMTDDMSGNLLDESFVNQLLSTLPKHDDGIDLFFMSHNIGNAAGVYHNNHKSCMIVNTERPFTLAHEMGHCFGLRHTHYGTEYYHKKNGEKGGLPELVNGSNSDSAGDYMNDTPADPNEWNNDGVYIGTYKDANGSLYTPDPKNFMSYSGIGGIFTSMQIKKMHKTLRTDLNRVLMKANIIGPKHFSTTSEYTHDLISSKELEWNVVRYQTPKADDTPEIIKEEWWPDGKLTITSSCSEYIEISLRATYTHQIFCRYTVTTGAPTPVTGTLLWRTTQNGTWNGSTTNMDWGETLYISGNTTIYLGYNDRAGASISNLGYRTVTAANRVLTGSSMTITKADCSKGYLKFRLSDSCGQGDGYFTIPVSVVGGYYAVDMTSGNEITFSSQRGSTSGNKSGISAKAPILQNLTIYDASKSIVLKKEHINSDAHKIDTSEWPKGEYHAILSDGYDYTQEIPFSI